MNILRSILGIIAGLIIGTIVISSLAMVVTLIYPPPTTLNPLDPNDLRIFYATRPSGAYAGMLITYFIGVFFAAFATAKVAGRGEALHGFIIILIYVALAVLKFSMFPEPAWSMIGSVVIYFLAGLAGSSFAGSLNRVQREGPVTSS